MATSTIYQPLDLSKSKRNPQSSGSREVLFSQSHDSFLLPHRPSPFVTSTEHIYKNGKKKDVDCNLSWSSTFGTAIPTTTIPPDLLPLHHQRIVPRPVPSRLFSDYRLPVSLSAIDSESMSGVHKAPISAPGCCCCSKVHGTVGTDATKRTTDCLTPALMFHNNYCIDSVNGFTPLRQDYMFPHRQTTETSSNLHPVEPFYNHIPKENKESMYYRPKDVCELWKYEGERIGFLSSNCSAVTPFKNTDIKMPSSETSIPTDRSDDEDKTTSRTPVTKINGNDKHRIMETLQSENTGKSKSNHYNPIIQSVENQAKNHEDLRSNSQHRLPQEPLEKNSNTEDENSESTSPALGTSSKGLVRPIYKDIIDHKALEEGGLEEDVMIDCGTSGQPNPTRPKSKDSIGPGYIEMIAKAILNSKSKRCMLTDIYKYISTTYSRYRDDTVCWRNIVRHHLSHYECFVKAEHNGHAHYWTINPEMEQDFANGKFHRKRRPNRRKRTVSSTKIMGNKSATLGSVTSPLASWFPGMFHHPYYHEELTKPYVFFHGHPWLNEDQMRTYYPYVLESNMARHPLEKSYR